MGRANEDGSFDERQRFKKEQLTNLLVLFLRRANLVGRNDGDAVPQIGSARSDLKFGDQPSHAVSN